MLQKHILSKNKKRLRRTHWPQTTIIITKQMFALKTHFILQNKKRLRRTHRPQKTKKNVKEMNSAPHTHFIPKKKSACGVRTGLENKNSKANECCSKKKLCPPKKSACGVRTGLNKKKTSFEKGICSQKNAFYHEKKKRLRRTHWPQTKM